MSPTASPTDSPTMSPTINCVDDDTAVFEIKEGQERDCEWLSERAKRADKYCETKGYNDGKTKIKYVCRGTCVEYLPGICLPDWNLPERALSPVDVERYFETTYP